MNRTKLLHSALLSVSGLALSLAASAQNEKPNVLFIAIDDMKPMTSNYGNPIAVTPGLEQIAREGVTFTNNHCQMALSGPSRASLMTGLRPDNCGVWSLQGNFRKINPELVTLTQSFMKEGYSAIGIGKIYHPLSAPKYRNDPMSWSEYIKTSAPTYALPNGRVATECADVPDNFYVDGVIADAAVDKLKVLKNSDKPFFLAVGFHKPHMPWVAPKKYWDMYDRERLPLAEFQQKSYNPVEYAYHSSNELKVYSDIPPFDSYEDAKHMDEATQRRLLHAYYACMSYTDAQIKRVVDELKAQGLDKNTIIVVWADHGYHLGDHGLWNKLTNFENATRAILMISAPGMAKDAKTATPSEFVDVYPTLCDLAGVQAPDYIDGVSLVPALRNPKTKVENYAISQFHRGNVQGYAIRDGRFRYVEWVSDFKTYLSFDESKVAGSELYDYDTDPLEKQNQVDNPKYRKTRDQLRKQLHDYYKSQYEKSGRFPVAKLKSTK